MNAAKLGLKEIKVHFGTFDHHLFCVVGPATHLEKYVAYRHGDPSFHLDAHPNGSRGLYFCKPGWVPIIWIPRKPRTPREHATLSHEVFHGIRYILVDWAGIPLNRDTDETFCHALGYAVAEILQALK